MAKTDAASMLTPMQLVIRESTPPKLYGISYFTVPRYRPQAGAMGLAAVTDFAFRILSTASN